MIKSDIVGNMIRRGVLKLPPLTPDELDTIEKVKQLVHKCTMPEYAQSARHELLTLLQDTPELRGINIFELTYDQQRILLQSAQHAWAPFS